MPISYFHDIYDECAIKRPETVGVISRGTARVSLTYAEIRERSLLLASGLQQYLDEHSRVLGASDVRTVAVQLPRTHPDFVPLLVAASRVHVPFVLLSTDLPDSRLQQQRNEFAVQLLKPHLHIMPALPDSPSTFGHSSLNVVTISIHDLSNKVPSHGISSERLVCGHSDILCFMFTGGTNRTKVVRVTHAMIKHEHVAYNEVWMPSWKPAVVLAHTSVYWGASALGQLSIALAYRGTVVWTESSEAATLKQCVTEEQVNVLGVVPDHLDLLAPESPSRELPNIEAVFTWGERLPQRTADRWRSHPRVVLRELLIATEYWLSLWADPLGDGVLRSVHGAKLLVLTENGSDASVGEVGELMIAGPMVMAGYHGSIGEVQETFHNIGSESFFRTRDLAQRVPGGIIYKGRADMMTKHKGKWVDLLVIEDQLSQMDGVRAAKVMPDPAHEHFHAFVALEESCSVGPALNRIRMGLPPRLQLWLVPHLPRHVVTKKVDVTKLSKVLAGLPPSWPVEGHLSFGDGPPLLRDRLTRKMYRQLCWQLAAFGIAWALADKNDLGSQLSYLAVYLPVLVFTIHHFKADNGLPIQLFLTLTWVFAAMFVQPPDTRRLAFSTFSLQPPDAMRLVRSTFSLGRLTYCFLALTYADSHRAVSLVARATMSVVDELPFWKLGFFITFSLGQHLPGLAGKLSLVLLETCAFVGILFAIRRRRFFAWSVVFWSVVIGHQLSRDCGAWLDPGYWWRNAYDKASRLLSAKATILQAILQFWRQRQPAQNWKPKDTDIAPSWTPDAPSWTPSCCSWCTANLGSNRWCAHDEKDQELCDTCGTEFCVKLEAAASKWLSSRGASYPPKRMDSCNGNEDPVERMPKIPRTEATKPQQTLLGKATEDEVKMEKDTEHAAHQEWLRKQSENWWWTHKTQETFDLDADAQSFIEKSLSLSAPSAPVQASNVPPEMRLLCNIIGEIEPLLKPVHGDTVLIGIDSLQLARLANAIRIQLGASLTMQLLREAKTVRELSETIAKAEATMPEAVHSNSEEPEGEEGNGEYAVWFSPGQYKPMGSWILRTEAPLDHAAFVKAAQLLVDRHAAMRARLADPLRYLSILYDAAVVFSLFAPFLMRGPTLVRWLRRLISRAFVDAWPRVKCVSREELYRQEFPSTLAPVEILQVHGGQTEFERIGKYYRINLLPPARITGYELVCNLADVWEFDSPQWKGKFAIISVPEGLEVPEDVKLVYVDLASNEWGPLISPGCRQWQVPPYGFPALFFIPLSGGSFAWLRLEKADELRFCYRESSARTRWNRRLVAYRVAPRREFRHPPLVVSFLSISLYHNVADGNCYLPLVQDFLTLYDAARGQAASRLPPIRNAFEELQRRLFDTFNCRPSPVRHSLRGALYGFCGDGYGYILGVGPGAISALTRTAVHYRVPLDITLLGIVLCAMARADRSELCDFTLYTPMRDGAAEAMAVGLFSDWRDLYINVEFDLATVLGTILQLYHKILHRQWSVFNAARKSERTVINIQPLDFEKRAGFKNLGENMWRDGDRLNTNETRGSRMNNAQQPAGFVIEQQDEDTWWILVRVGYEKRPCPWMRSFATGFHDALSAFLFEPLALVHQPLPDDDVLLDAAWTQGMHGRPVCVRPPG